MGGVGVRIGGVGVRKKYENARSWCNNPVIGPSQKNPKNINIFEYFVFWAQFQSFCSPVLETMEKSA